MLFPRFDKLLTTKNTNATFFLVGGSNMVFQNSGHYSKVVVRLGFDYLT